MNKFSVVLLSFLAFAGCSGTRPDLGIHNGSLMPCPKTPNCVNSQTDGEKHYVEPIRFMGTQQKARDRLLQVLESEQQAKVFEIREDYIRTEFTSVLFRFIDDVEFYFPETQSGEILIHIRSASRLGHFDFGVNQKRVEQIRKRLNENP